MPQVWTWNHQSVEKSEVTEGTVKGCVKNKRLLRDCVNKGRNTDGELPTFDCVVDTIYSESPPLPICWKHDVSP